MHNRPGRGRTRREPHRLKQGTVSGSWNWDRHVSQRREDCDRRAGSGYRRVPRHLLHRPGRVGLLEQRRHLRCACSPGARLRGFDKRQLHASLTSKTAWNRVGGRMIPLSAGRTITNTRLFVATIVTRPTPAIATSGTVWPRHLTRCRAAPKAGGWRAAGGNDCRWRPLALGVHPRRVAQDGAPPRLASRPIPRGTELTARSTRRRRAPQR